jgi:transcriptional regulator with XRE-family HTH domain
MATREVNREALRAIRELVGVEQTDLAKRCGITQGHLSNIERGDRLPSPKVLRALASELGVPLDAISHAAQEVASPPQPVSV